MEVAVNDVHGYLATWQSGGSDRCRAALIARHAHIHEPEHATALSAAYNALLNAALKSWAPAHVLAPDALAGFLVSVLQGLPSSSSSKGLSATSPDVLAFSELFTDLVWVVDCELYDIVNVLPPGVSEAPKKAQTDAETDKATLVTLVAQLLTARALDPMTCAAVLDSGLLEKTKAIANKATFDSRQTRARTSALYRQTKYNLFRERSEGFSKLIAELIASLGPAHDPATGRPIESDQEIRARAQAAWDRLVGLVGYFDLDPVRTLDVILDVFATYVATHWSFFIALLNCSPWPTRIHPEARGQGPMPSFAGKTFDEILTLAQEHVQGRVPPPVGGPQSAIAQMMGFKFRYYQSEDVPENAPKELYVLAALLLREGFMALEELWTHLGDDDFQKADPAMDALHKAYHADVKERIAGAKVSQLAMAAPLEAGEPGKSAKAKTAEPVQSKADEKKQLAAANQRVMLVVSLLSLGALRTALPVLARYPWLVDAVPQVADVLLELMAHSTRKLCEESYPTDTKPQDKLKECPPASGPPPDWTVPKARYGAGGLTRPPPPKSQLTMTLPAPPRTSATQFVYFFPDWADQIPVLEDWDDVMPVVGGFLAYIKVQAHRNIGLFHRLFCLIFKHLYIARPDEREKEKELEAKRPDGDRQPVEKGPVYTFWLAMMRTCIFPAYSLVRGNAGLVVTLQSIMRHIDPTDRWPLYAEWKTTMMQSHPELRLRAIQVDRESKGILRRLSHETVDSLGGAIAKLVHHNPCIFLSHALNQVTAYSNLSAVLVKSFSRLTMMSFDVLNYLICDALANPDKERVKDDGVNLTDWLQNLSSFAAMVMHRYTTQELTQLLKYIVHQLSNRQTTEIVVLQDLIGKMSGIEPLPSMSDYQVAAMSGGPMLRIEAVAPAQRGSQQNWMNLHPQSASKLARHMLDSGLATPLLVLVCQQRQACVFNTAKAHLRSLSSLFDNIHTILYQFLEFLTTIDLRLLSEKAGTELKPMIPLEEYASKVVPPLADLHGLYDIDAAICMTLYRPILNNIVLAAEAAEASERSKEAARRLAAAKAQGKTPDADAAGTPTEVSLEEVDIAVIERTGPWIPDLAARFSDLKSLAPDAWEGMTPGFYMTFWQMSMYDLSPPKNCYETELTRLRRMVDALSVKNPTDEQTRISRRLTNIMAALTRESTAQQKTYQFTKRRLAREKAHWFVKGTPVAEVARAVIEYCIQPRCLLSPMDAEYCAEIIKVIHQEKTPVFYTLRLYDLLLGKHVGKTIFACSENEAQNYGRFLARILADLWKWFETKKDYEEEHYVTVNKKSTVLPGFGRVWASKGPEESVQQTYDYFKSAVKKWYRTLAKCFCACIESGEFMHIKNAILVLQRISDYFPMAAVEHKEGPMVNAAVEKFLQNGEKGSLQVLCQSYHSTLQKRASGWQVSAKGTTKAPEADVAPSTRGTRPPVVRRESGPAEEPGANQSLPPPPRPERPSSSSRPSPVPRPDVIKRVRPANGSVTPAGNGRPDAMDVDVKPKETIEKASPSEAAASSSEPASIVAPRPTPVATSLARDVLQRQASSIDASSSPGGHSMRPPAVPSQTLTSHDLRESARASSSHPKTDEGRSTPGSPRLRRRSASPGPRTGGARTRSGSLDSRAGTDPEREDRRSSHRSQRYDDRSREPSGRSDRPDRERGSHREHGERDREARNGKEREERESRDKDRRDREHRREEKERNRERRERDPSSRTTSAAAPLPADDRDGSSRQDSRRRSSPPGDTTPKRRRPEDDLGDRDPKRVARRDGPRDKDSRESREYREERRDRDSSRRRRDRGEGDDRSAPSDRPSDKRPIDSPIASLPPSVPSGPRAMTSADSGGPTSRYPRADGPPRGDAPRGDRGPPIRDLPVGREFVQSSHDGPPRRDLPAERDYSGPRGQQRDYPPPRDPYLRGNGGNGHNAYEPPAPLLARMGDTDVRPRGQHPMDNRNGRPDRRGPDNHTMDDRDDGRKRGIEESASEVKDATQKRLKLDRSRYIINDHLKGGMQEKPSERPRKMQ